MLERPSTLLAFRRLFGRQRRQRQGVKTGGDFFRGRRINPALALDSGKTGEACRDNTNPEVGFASFTGAGVPGMTRAFVFDQKFKRRESSFEFLAQALCNGMWRGHGAPKSDAALRVKPFVFLSFRLCTP